MDNKYYKYLYYKNKYINLKNQLGGNPLSFIDKESYYKQVNLAVIQPPFSLILNFIQLYKSISPPPPLHILIGASNIDDNDYYRFKDSIYTLFIDYFDLLKPKEPTDIIKYKERLHDMFTISTQDTKDFPYMTKTMFNVLIGSPTANRLYEMVDSIATDLNTAYFLNRDIYITNAANALKKGGKFTFHHLHQREQKVTRFKTYNEGNPDELKYIIVNVGESSTVPDSITVQFDINKDNKTVNLKEEYLTRYFNGQPLLSPTYPFLVLASMDIKDMYGNLMIKYYTDNIYDSYRRYLQSTYPMFNVSIHECNLMDFTYPVPIPNLSSSFQLKIFQIIVNDIMTESERNKYLTTKKISQDELNILIDRVIGHTELHKIFFKDKPKIDFNQELFRNHVNYEFKYVIHYVEMQKN